MLTKTVDKRGTIRYFDENADLHQDGDLPAVIWKDGTIAYCKNGQNHRLAGPAWIYSDGSVRYCICDIEYNKYQFDNHPLVREYRLKLLMEGLLNG